MLEPMAVLLGLAVLGILFVVPIIVLVRLSGACRGIEDVQRRLIALEQRMAERNGQETPPPRLEARLEEALMAVRVTPEATAEDDAAGARIAGAERPSTETPPPVPAREQPPPVPAEPSAFERAVQKAWNWIVIGEEFRKPGESWEYAAATNWLLRSGIVIALAGVAFFLKYSIEKGLMGPLGRVALTLAAGLLLITVGVRMLFKRYHLLGQGMAGAGFVTLYFAFYASSLLYHLTTSAAAFALMACVTLAAGVLAVIYRSPLIALLGMLGGYATPVMVGQADASTLFLYAYVLLLGCGVLGISLVRRWPMLNVLGMVAAYGLAYWQCEGHAVPEQCVKDLIFLSAVHLLYLSSAVVHHVIRGIKTGAFEWAALFLNAGIYWAWAFVLFQPIFGKEGTGLITLAVAAAYVALTYACMKRQLADQALLSVFIGLAAVFLALSPMLMASGEWLTLAWCLQALVMVWISEKTGASFLGKAAAVLFAAACVRGMGHDLERIYEEAQPWLLKGPAFWKEAGLRLVTFGVLPATLAAAWRLVRTKHKAAKVLGLVLFQVWLYVTLESGVFARAFVPEFRAGAVTLAWTGFAFALLFSGIRVNGRWLRWCGLGLFALAVAKLLLVDLDGLDSLYRIFAFVAVGVLLVAGSFIYLKYKNLFERAVADTERGEA